MYIGYFINMTCWDAEERELNFNPKPKNRAKSYLFSIPIENQSVLHEVGVWEIVQVV